MKPTIFLSCLKSKEAKNDCTFMIILVLIFVSSAQFLGFLGDTSSYSAAVHCNYMQDSRAYIYL